MSWEPKCSRCGRVRKNAGWENMFTTYCEKCQEETGKINDNS